MKRIFFVVLGLMLATTFANAQDKNMRTEKDGSVVVNTTSIGKDLIGFNDIVPVEITIKADKVVKIVALENYETPEYFEKAKALLAKWTGKTVKEAAGLEVDAVSGATYSSDALIGNVRGGLQYYQKATAKTK